VETGAIGIEVETQAGGGDHLDIEIGEIAAGGGADAVEPAPHDMQGILGGVEEDAPGPLHGEAAQAGRAGGDRDGEVECEEGFAAFRLAADDADGFLGPQAVDQPALFLSPAALVEAIATLGACPAADHLAGGRLVIGPWAAEKEPPEFWRAVISGLAAKGIKTALLPVLLSASEDSAGKLAPLSYEMSY
jgi:hypothetical protein